MGLIAGLKSILSKRQIKFSDGSDDESHQRIVYIGHQPVYLSTKQATSDQASSVDKNVSVGIRLMSDTICSLPINVEGRTAINGVETWENIPDHPAKKLLIHPNDFHDSDDIMRHIIQSLIQTGEAYFYFERGISEPTQLIPVPMLMMQLVYNKNTGMPSHFVYDPYKSKRVMQPEDVLYLRLYDASRPFEGKAAVTPIMEQILSSMHAVEINKQFFKNGALLSMLFGYDESAQAMAPEEEKNFLKSFTAAFTGSKKSNKVGLLPKGISVKQAMASMKDMMFAELIRLNREEIFSQLGIPPSEGGVYEYANYANAIIQKQSFWENTILPKLSLIEKGINRQYLSRFWPKEDLRMKFDISSIGVLKEDQLTKARVDEIYIRTGKTTINELRKRDGQEEVEWGDEPPSNLAPIMTDPETKQAMSDGNESFASVKGQHRVMSRSFSHLLSKFEKQCAVIYAKFFEAQRRRIIASLREKTSDGLMMSAVLFPVIQFAGNGNLPDDAGLVFDISIENKELKQKTGTYYKQSTKTAGTEAVRQAAQMTGKKVSFNVQDPRVTNMLKDLENRSELINDATFEDIKGLLRNAYNNKLNLSELASGINDLYGEYGRGRAEMIARTEMLSVLNGASTEGYAQAGIEKHQWLASIDEATREEHAAADGTIVNIDEPFIVGGESLYYPGDPAGSAWNICNCRCTTIPVFEEE